MAFASHFTTIVTKLRFRSFVWTTDLYKNGFLCDFNIFENEEQNKINFQIIVKDLNGQILDTALHQDINVNNQTILLCGYLVNLLMDKFGVQVHINTWDSLTQ